MKQTLTPGDIPSNPAQADVLDTTILDPKTVISKAITQLAILGNPYNTHFNEGRYVGRLGKLCAPKYEAVYEASALGVVAPDKPFIHVPETPKYTFGWHIPDVQAVVTQHGTAFTDPIAVEHDLLVVTGPELTYEEWHQHGLEAHVVADWLTRLCKRK